jgi:hypothetical protein
MRGFDEVHGATKEPMSPDPGEFEEHADISKEALERLGEMMSGPAMLAMALTEIRAGLVASLSSAFATGYATAVQDFQAKKGSWRPDGPLEKGEGDGGAD